MAEQTIDILPQFIRKADWLFPDDFDRPAFWLAGGSILSLLKSAKVNDWDLFSNDPKSVIDWLKSKDTPLTFENDMVANFKWGRHKVQVIKKYTYPNMAATIENFDFTCICAAYNGNEFVCHERFYLDAAQQRLVINKHKLPLSTLQRAIKYSRRGYVLCPKALASICRAINELEIDWNNPDQNMIEFYPDGTPTFKGID